MRRTPHAYLWLSGIATLLAVPLAALALMAADPAVYWGATTGAIALLFLSTGPVNSMIVNVVRPDMRATAVAGSIFTIHVLGDVPSPTLLGVLSDTLQGGLAAAVLIIPVAVLVSGLIWTYAAWRESRGTERVNRLEDRQRLDAQTRSGEQ